jgi:phosphoglycerate dehydrogenase-like enzyme
LACPSKEAAMQPTVIMTTLTYQGKHWQRLREALGDAEVIRIDARDDPAIAAALERAEVALIGTDPDARYFRAPRLRWIHADHAGLNKAAKPEVFDRGLILTSSAGRSSPVLADHALFFIMALAYRFPAFLDAQRAHRWGGVPGQENLRGLFGRTIGIVGLGHTGCELAVRAKAHGMRVLGYRRRDAAAPLGVDQVFCTNRGDGLDALLRQSDALVLALPLSDATHHLIGERELALLPPGAFLVNMGRGNIIDEAALLAALRAGRLGGAGLDVVAQEPLPPDSPLWDAPNLLITPHFTPAVPDRIGRSLDIICENLRRFRAGEPMLNALTREDIYTRG